MSCVRATTARLLRFAPDGHAQPPHPALGGHLLAETVRQVVENGGGEGYIHG